MLEYALILDNMCILDMLKSCFFYCYSFGSFIPIPKGTYKYSMIAFSINLFSDIFFSLAIFSIFFLILKANLIPYLSPNNLSIEFKPFYIIIKLL